MKFVGSKRRIAKKIIPFLKKVHIPNARYIEPFVGGGNMIQAVPFENRYGSDTDRYIIAYLEAIRDGWVPPGELTKEEYIYIKGNRDLFLPEVVGFVGYACSFGAKFFGGYAQGDDRNFAEEGQRNAIKQAPLLQGVKLKQCTYDNLFYPTDTTVYMDPPYEGTLGYQSGSFDHQHFWNLATDISEVCSVFVSEYKAPEGWISLLSEEVKVGIDTGVHKKETEQLFVLRNGLAHRRLRKV